MKIYLGKDIENVKKKDSETENNLLKNRDSEDINELDEDDIYFNSNTIKNIKIGSNTVNRVYLNNSIVYELQDTIIASKFHSLVPATATNIIFDKIENQDITNYNLVGYCDVNNYIAVYNINTSYLVLNVRNAENFAPSSCYQLFYNYVNLVTLEFFNFNAKYILNTYQLFTNCRKLLKLDLSSFDFSNVISNYQTFWECNSLTEIKGNLNFRFSGNMCYGLFYRCNNLKFIDLSKCAILTTNFSSMFLQCRVITSIIFPVQIVNSINCYRTFYQCNQLKTIISQSWVNAGGPDCFYQCDSLQGGNGTTYSSAYITAEYARVDGENGLPGYFTAPAA